MDERIENTYTQNGRITKPTEQVAHVPFWNAWVIRSVGFAIRLHRILAFVMRKKYGNNRIY